jgi:lipopolysaccharide/colanic/teichoic acid biosynthesis glycosyltransferase
MSTDHNAGRASRNVARVAAGDSISVDPFNCHASAPCGASSEHKQASHTSDSARETPEIPGWKRLLDLTCILLTLPIWLTAICLVSIWTLIASPGPLLYRQERVGYRGRHFMILKFRTMHVNAETKSHEGYFEKLMQTDCPMAKLDICGDARLIRGGRILRALGLDELPQIFNVLRGEMSLVGPRPCTPHEFEHYQPAQKERVDAPPGITGYWQVNGKNKTSFSQMISMDIYYGKHMSVLMDLMIILKTLPAIGIQVAESLKRKTGAKLGRLMKRYAQKDDATGRLSGSELEKEARKNT